MVKSKYGIIQFLSHAIKILFYVTVNISALAQNQSTLEFHTTIGIKYTAKRPKKWVETISSYDMVTKFLEMQKTININSYIKKNSMLETNGSSLMSQ